MRKRLPQYGRGGRDEFRFTPSVVALLLCSGLPLWGADLAVTSVRFWSLGDMTRIAVETNGSFRTRTDRLSNPDRVFYDLLGAHNQIGDGRQHILTVGDGLVKQIRIAEPQKSTTRVVLDLEVAGADVTASQLSNPDRLMIEVRPQGGTAAPSTTPSVTGVKKIPQTEGDPKPAVVKPTPEPPVVARNKPVLTAPPSVAANLGMKVAAPEPSLPAAPPAPTPSPTPAPAKTAVPEVPIQTAKRNSNGERSLTRVLGLKIRRVVIDAGHGGHDHGTTGPTGFTEKELVLDVAKRLGKLIEDQMGSEVTYTREEDEFIPLEARPSIANRNKADLFLSIHANSSPIRTVSGAETYYLNFTTSRTALDTAARENAASTKSVYELRDLLQKIALKDKVDESREFANRVQTALNGLVAPVVRTASKQQPPRDRGVKKAPFVVLIGASMPAVLAEIGFLSNPREEQMLKRPDQRQKIAEALLRGILQYEASLSHFVAQRKPADD